MTIYSLYIKEHRQTGLKYLGHTKQDPYKYKGSGIHWKRHLKKHGEDVETTVLNTFTNIEDLTKAGLEYSRLHNIVESKDWANMIPEDGKRNPLFKPKGGRPSDETRQKMSAALKGRVFSEEHRRKMAESARKRASSPEFIQALKDGHKKRGPMKRAANGKFC